ncbi:organic cation/carnitine transporter 2-like [Eucyclogobius newberryi]|uniref:organic cation/carnitine transporter 2-like n=1 Tax=Eucyclogobius newberryi TaxID=166745 RepID=UPI003B5A4B59
MSGYDKAVAFLGDWGLFQKIVFTFYYLSMVPNGFTLGIVFVADTPKHQCLIPDVNLTHDWLQAIIPVNVVNGVEERSRCSRYMLDVVMDLWAQGSAPGDVNLTQLQQEPCVDGWSYSKDIYQSTLVSQFDLVCSDQWKQPLTTTVYFIGILVGSLILGQVSDRYVNKFSMCMGYFGVSLNTSKLTPDPYLGSLLSAAVEVPAAICTWLALRYLPRRVCVGVALLLGGVSLLSRSIIPPSLQWLSITMEMIGKFGFANSMNLLFAYTAEVFPTVLRNTATGICSTFARIGNCTAPFILQLGLYYPFLPSIVLGALAAGSSIGAAFLPETFRQPLLGTGHSSGLSLVMSDYKPKTEAVKVDPKALSEIDY